MSSGTSVEQRQSSASIEPTKRRTNLLVATHPYLPDQSDRSIPNPRNAQVLREAARQRSEYGNVLAGSLSGTDFAIKWDGISPNQIVDYSVGLGFYEGTQMFREPRIDVVSPVLKVDPKKLVQGWELGVAVAVFEKFQHALAVTEIPHNPNDFDWFRNGLSGDRWHHELLLQVQKTHMDEAFTLSRTKAYNLGIEILAEKLSRDENKVV